MKNNKKFARALAVALVLVMYPVSYNHEINPNKMKKEGYEPRRYAEKPVDEWFKTDCG